MSSIMETNTFHIQNQHGLEYRGVLPKHKPWCTHDWHIEGTQSMLGEMMSEYIKCYESSKE